MAIAEQFAGLEMDKLIGAPLTAAADASVQLANSTAEFINTVGFDKNGSVRTVSFGYEGRTTNEDGTSNLDKMKVDVPMIAIVPIPNLQVDEVNVLFDMEVKQAEKSENSLDVGAKLSGSGTIGPVKVSVTGSVSVHQANTRSSDNSAKYHVDVRATNHGTPEGLARVLDMMAANVAPVLIGSTIKDGKGQDLPAEAKKRAEKLKALRNERSQSDAKLKAAKEIFDNKLLLFKNAVKNKMAQYESMLPDDATVGEDQRAAYDTLVQKHEQVMGAWDTFYNSLANQIELAVAAEKSSILSAVMKLVVNQDFSAVTTPYDHELPEDDLLKAAQDMALKAWKAVLEAQTQQIEKDTAYNAELAK